MTDSGRVADATGLSQAEPQEGLGPTGFDPSRIERTWMKEPCGPCPYSRAKTLWLHPERAADFAYNAGNPYSDFPCHKTADLFEDEDGHSEYHAGARSLTCNGFLSLQVNENGGGPYGFVPHADAFGDHWEMIEHHECHWEDERRRRDSDGSPEGRDAQRLDGEAATARAEGIAQPSSPSQTGDSNDSL